MIDMMRIVAGLEMEINWIKQGDNNMTSEAELWKSISKITPNSSTDNAEEDCDDAIWACNLIQKQDREDWDGNMLLNSENAKRTRLNLKKQLDHTTDSQLASMAEDAFTDPSTFIGSDPTQEDINKHLSSIDKRLASTNKHLANIETLLKQRK